MTVLNKTDFSSMTEQQLAVVIYASAHTVAYCGLLILNVGTNQNVRDMLLKYTREKIAAEQAFVDIADGFLTKIHAIEAKAQAAALSKIQEEYPHVDFARI